MTNPYGCESSQICPGKSFFKILRQRISAGGFFLSLLAGFWLTGCEQTQERLTIATAHVHASSPAIAVSHTPPGDEAMKKAAAALRKTFERYLQLNPYSADWDTVLKVQGQMKAGIQHLFSGKFDVRSLKPEQLIPESGTVPTISLTSSGTILVTSKDEKFWVFNWDEKGGGSGHYYSSMMVYLGNKKPVVYDAGGAEYGEMPFTLYAIHDHPGATGTPVYVLEMANETGGAGSYEVYLIPVRVEGNKIRQGISFVFDERNGDRYDSGRGEIMHPDGTRTVL